MKVSDNDIRRFQEAILEHSDYDFSEYTLNSLKRRLTKILDQYGNSVDELIDRLAGSETALEEVIKKITVCTTELFRDPAIWKHMMYSVLPRYSKATSINIWHPGCSTGQEVYSMMIILDHLGLLEKCNILATDINTDALVAAEKGEYRYRFNKTYMKQFDDVFTSGENEPVELYADWHKYMEVDETHDLIIMNETMRSIPEFRKTDLVSEGDYPDMKFDIIMCRNVIIYFNFELQNRVIRLMHGRLLDNGCLVLGVHESIIGACADLFVRENNVYFSKPKQW